MKIHTFPALFAGLLLAAPFIARAADAAASVKPYPLDVCIVTDNDLGSMGDERRFVHEGQEIKICCKPCEARFRKNPARYLKKLTPIPAEPKTETGPTSVNPSSSPKPSGHEAS